MKTVRAFECLDGTVHTNELQAMMTDYTIEIRGLIQSDGKLGNTSTLTTTDFAKCVSRKGEEFAEVIRKYTNKIRGYNNRGKKIGSA